MTRNDKCSHGALLTEGCEDCGAVPQSASTIVATTPPDLAEHPYYAHVRNCEYCSGPHGHCAEGLKLKNADVATDFTEQAMLDWLQDKAEEGHVSMCFEVDGGVHVTLEPLGGERRAVRNADTIRDAIIRLMKEDFR